ncbi:N-acetylmuramoyl-L-alanine amidase [Hazenella sp. IB182357]|uniref:N-acetylmuramoyl-L-alanine amidase n=1 Tax=Polycladospora coralii TaxID=2771432 RepID=A0A926RY88_9BACL|nr:N-acetylmuramoyl-L-alanine amidase [Polycladospora coralii]MBD1373276.1 N-acetylmuramoyl-L-alanine amidase [Polycladospora coralii]MBS7528890.1 N-acetylmuramoyl-L-alanine amidase [Polycladospora coralii]
MTKIVIDPGHGGSDPGAVSGSYREKDFNLTIGKKVRDYLNTFYIVDVLMTRDTDKTLSLTARTNYANSQNADYYCSIHVNAGGGTGWESFIYNGSVSNKTIQAREIIHNSVMNKIGPMYGVRNRGKKRANFHVLRETQMSAVLLENLFIDTARDLSLLRSSSFINDLSSSISEGLAIALSLQPKTITLYKVIAGSFLKEENAEERRDFLIQNGIDAFISPTNLSGVLWYRVQAGAFSERKNAEDRVVEIKQLGITDVFIL